MTKRSGVNLNIILARLHSQKLHTIHFTTYLKSTAALGLPCKILTSITIQSSVSDTSQDMRTFWLVRTDCMKTTLDVRRDDA